MIAASILSADMSKLGEDTKNVLDAGADFIHVDVMDNHYVPNLTFGPIVVRALRNFGIQAPLDVHLMIDPVDRIIPEFAEAGADYITFHPEASENIGQTLNLIRQCKCKPGLVFNPGTPLDILALSPRLGEVRGRDYTYSHPHNLLCVHVLYPHHLFRFQ